MRGLLQTPPLELFNREERDLTQTSQGDPPVNARLRTNRQKLKQLPREVTFELSL